MFRCFWPRHSINWYLHLKQIGKTYQPTLPKLFCAASNIPMDSNTSGFLLNSSSLESVYYQAKEEDAFIDLGLSLRTLPPEAYHPSGHRMPFLPWFLMLNVVVVYINKMSPQRFISLFSLSYISHHVLY